MKYDYLSKENTNCLRGFFASMVVLHHLSGVVPCLYNLMEPFPRLFGMLGFFSVAVFFFLSGYGLIISYHEKTDYLETFWHKRIIPLYMVFMCFIVLYTLLKLICGSEISIMLFGVQIVGNGGGR